MDCWILAAARTGGDPAMKKKEFDCVEMKREIQQQILEEMQGLSPEEQLRRTEKAVTSDPILARFWNDAPPS